MKENYKGKWKIIIAFAILFVVVVTLLVLVFYAGKKSYTVTFDLNGGTLISGSLEQHVVRGQDATPPTAVMEGAYLRSWSASTKQVTKNMVVRAIWEYETTPGIIYSSDQSQNYAEILGSFEYLKGEVYLGAYYGDKKILGICDGAFEGRAGITKIYLLDGIVYIGENAFADCSGLTEIEIPKTVTHIEAGAFKGCTSLEKITLHDGILEIGEGAFEGCSSLKEITLPNNITDIGDNMFNGCSSLEAFEIPSKVTHIGENAFKGCTSLTNISISSTVKAIEKDAFADCDNLTIKANVLKLSSPIGWETGWQGSATVEWRAPSIRPVRPGLLDEILRPGIGDETDTEIDADTDTETETEAETDTDTETDKSTVNDELKETLDKIGKEKLPIKIDKSDVLLDLEILDKRG